MGTAFLYGNGGGDGLALAFKAYATEAALLADTPAENTIGVVTQTAIAGQTLQSEEPPIAAPEVTPNSYTKLLLCGGDLVNYSPSGLSVTNTGVSKNTAVKKSNDSSLYFNGSSYLQAADNDRFDFGSNNFTLDGWFYFTSNSRGYQTLIDKRTTGADQTGWILLIETNNTLAFLASPGGAWSVAINTTQIPAVNAWVHLAVVRNGTAWTMYYNGTAIGSATSSITIGNTTSPLRVGNCNVTNTGYYYGYVDGLRISNGIARWTAAFTPPTDIYALETLVSEGDVWLSVGSSSPAQMNISPKNGLKVWVYPLFCKQRIGGAWRVKTSKIFTDSAWVDLRMWIYDNGTVYKTLAGYGDPMPAFNASNVSLVIGQETSEKPGGFIFSSDSLALTGRSTLKVRLSGTTPYNTSSTNRFGISSTKGYVSSLAQTVFPGSTAMSGVYTCDISSVNSGYFFVQIAKTATGIPSGGDIILSEAWCE